MTPDYSRVLVETMKRLQREEASCDRLIEVGIFGDAAKDRPWPDHDKALVRDFKRSMERECIMSIALLMRWVNNEDATFNG